MGSQVVEIDESVVVFGSSSYAVIERIAMCMRGAPEYTVTRPGAERILIARVVRRGFGRRTVSCTVTVVNEPQRLLVGFRGEIEAHLVEQLRAAALGRSRETEPQADVVSQHVRNPSATGPEFTATPISQVPGMVLAVPAFKSLRPPTVSLPQQRSDVLPQVQIQGSPNGAPVSAVVPGSVPEGDRTIIRRATGSLSPPSVSSDITPMIVISDGRRIEVTNVVLFGRDPSARANEPTGTLVRINDALVSKTHLAIFRNGNQLWVEDRGSVNGTLLTDLAGRGLALEPGRRALLATGSTLTIGDTTLVYALG